MTRAMFNVIGSAAVPEVLVIKEQHATVRSLVCADCKCSHEVLSKEYD